MLNGFVTTYGEKAITIQTEGGNQYYGPKENITDPEIFTCLSNNIKFIPVKFMVDFNNSSGSTRFGKRYYAYDIQLDALIF